MQPIETAFGRPARWRGAIPAVAVGFGSLLLGIYSIFVLPERLRPQYLASLSSAQAEYRELTESTTPFVSWRLGEVAGDLDVIFSRLIGLEAGQPERYWEWAEFLETHTKNLDKRLQDSAASVQDDVKTRLEKQAREFDAKALELYHQLASGQSIFQPRALLREAEHFYVQGIASLGVDDNSGLTDKLRDLWNESTDQSSEFRDSAQLMLVRMLIENAWQHSDGSRLIFQPKPAREALDVCQDKTYQSVSKQHQARIQAASSLLQAMLGDLNDENTLSVVNDLEEFISVDFSDEWNDQLAELELAMLDSDWPKISYVLSKKSIQENRAITNGLARTICRLTCSPFAEKDNKWVSDLELRLKLVSQIAPFLPEFSELLWECAYQQYSKSESQVRVSLAVREAIGNGQHTALKHVIAVLASTFSKDLGPIPTHLEIIRRIDSNLAIVSRAILWQAQTFAQDEKLANDASSRARTIEFLELMNSVVNMEPEIGFHWFVLGTLQFQTNRVTEMQDSLKRAKELLGDIPAIDQMLRTAQ